MQCFGAPTGIAFVLPVEPQNSYSQGTRDDHTPEHKSQQNFVFGTRTVIGKLKFLKTSHAAKQIHSLEPWVWLREHKPDSFEQLISQVEASIEERSRTTRTVMRQLAQVFQWCKEHDIELSLFDLPRRVARYRAAASYLYHTVMDASSTEAAEQGIREAVAGINSHRTNRETRTMVRRPRK